MTPHAALLLVLASCAGQVARRAAQASVVVGVGALLVAARRSRRG